MHIPFRNSSLQYSLGSIPLHCVLHSFQSHSVHPLPIIWRALRPATAAGLSWFLNPGTGLEANQKTTPNPCILSSCQPPFHGFCCHHCGRRTQPLPVVPPSSGFLSARSAPTRHGGQVCRRSMLLLAAGAITFFANAQL